MSVRSYNALFSWTGVGRWTLVGTLACVLVSVTFNALIFEGLGSAATKRGLVSATVLPIILGVPLFFYMSVRLRDLELVNRRLGMVARTDSLTACLNRGAFTTKVEAMLEAGKPQRGALLMIDADNFKSINDLYGHDAGDEALTIIARSIRAVLRTGDLVGRMGGEEFAVFLPDVDQTAGEMVAERIRRSVHLAQFNPHGKAHDLTVSVGGAVFSAPASFSELFRIADQRLYFAKQHGRNQTVVVHADDHPVIALKKSA